MSKKLDISPLELEIMNLIWSFEKAISVREVVDKGYPKGEKAYTTVQTVMNNLETKGFLTKEKIGLVNFYSVIVKKNQIIEKETNNFIKSIFQGSSLSLVNYLIGENKLSENEISKLKTLIDAKEKENS